MNAISDVVQNRPRPIRRFDQIHMKVGDMILQSEIVASWADGRDLVFIGDGDAISVSVAYLKSKNVFSFGPKSIHVVDFDERTVNAINSFAEHAKVPTLSAELYNVLDPLPLDKPYDCFYTNPPWGASNNGESVNVFAQRGMEAVQYSGSGMIVIADSDKEDWPKRVLANVQRFALTNGFYISRMQRQLHEYHLDDAPTLKSCNLFLSSQPDEIRARPSEAITDPARLNHFYGKSQGTEVRYVRSKMTLGYGVAHPDEYELQNFES